MFIRRKALDRRRLYTREFFERLVGMLREAGLNDISVILPHNYQSVDPNNSNVSLSDYLARERNFAAIILKAQSCERKELMKILLINNSSKAVFVDDTYPSAASEPPSMYFQSPDPARAYAVFEYFFCELSRPPIFTFTLYSIFQIVSMVFVIAEALSFTDGHRGLIAKNWQTSNWWDLLLIMLLSWSLMRFFARPTGLWIKPTREIRYLNLIKMAIRGEFKDNPVVQLVVTVIATLIGAILAKLLGLI
jgi:hypothetical protein